MFFFNFNLDLSCTGAVGVAPVHQSVLGRRYCFQLRGGPHGERYYSCGSRQERDLWIYSLRKSIAPNAEHIRHTDNSLKMWIYEAKNLPSKKRYFCELHLDKTLYGRTSVKLQTDLLFWGEYFDFPDIPEVNVITVNVYREIEKKKKRDKHTFVGSVKIPIHEVTTRLFSEDWYPILTEKNDSLNRNGKESTIPTLRIKCRFQSIDILPINVYGDFLNYLKDDYKKVCEHLEPVIGVKAKEDIGHSLVMLMHAQGLAGAFLTDVVALDLLRVGDQRLTFRGNSLATKSMEAFLKLTGEQYLQDTLAGPINEIIQSDRDCEVDPTKTHGGSGGNSGSSLQRQQAALRSAVRTVWQCIYDSHQHFPAQLRNCFATFRERLEQLGRQDMADNLISASIFLRFLCPAILSPSLFNITAELPSTRATRNLTLVAKTLQTLANFTRFQGKENFMEFLNDFLEQEASRMKEFLQLISTRSEYPTPESILDWAGYIDQGKQLSILHVLLSESIAKLPENRQYELEPLQQILEEITKAKENNSFIQHIPSHMLASTTTAASTSSSTSSSSCSSSAISSSHENQENRQPINDGHENGGRIMAGHRNGVSSGGLRQQHVQLAQPQHAVISKPITTERGIMRGILTPSSLEKNIFRFNDPTVSSLLQQQQQQQLNNNRNHQIDKRHSNSQNSITASNLNGGNGTNLSHAQSQSSLGGSGGGGLMQLHGTTNIGLDRHYYSAAVTSAVSASGGHASPISMTASNSNLSSVGHHNGNEGNCCPPNTLSGLENNSLRPTTLPRGNNNNNAGSYDDMHGEFIQISGLDTNSAFVKKSPTPLLKNGLGQTPCPPYHQQQQRHHLHHTNNNNHHTQQTAHLTGSSLSLALSDRTPSKLNLGIPDHSSTTSVNAGVVTTSTARHSPTLIINGHKSSAQHLPSYQRPREINTRQTSAHTAQAVPSCHMPMNLEDLDDLFKYAEEHAVVGEVTPANCNPATTKETISTKSSQGSSSGYQSINNNSNNNNNRNGSPLTSHSTIPEEEEQQKNNNNGGSSGLPLAFKNPSYQLQQGGSSNGGNRYHQQQTHHHHHYHHHQRGNYGGNNITANGVGLTAHQQLFGNGNQQRQKTSLNGGGGVGIVAARAALLNGGTPLTPSSSEERLSSTENNNNHHNQISNSSSSYVPHTHKLLKSPSHGHIDAQRTLSGGSAGSGGSSGSSTDRQKPHISKSVLNQTVLGPRVIPRTNPQFKREDIYAPLLNGSNSTGGTNGTTGSSSGNYLTSSSSNSSNSTTGLNGVQSINPTQFTNSTNGVGITVGTGNNNNSSGHNRYQRRLSLDSARTLSDSSTDTEGKFNYFSLVILDIS